MKDKEYPKYLGEHDGKAVIAADREHHDRLDALHPNLGKEPEPGPTPDEQKHAVAQLHEAHERIAKQDAEIAELKSEIQRLQSPLTGGQVGGLPNPENKRGAKATPPPSPV